MKCLPKGRTLLTTLQLTFLNKMWKPFPACINITLSPLNCSCNFGQFPWPLTALYLTLVIKSEAIFVDPAKQHENEVHNFKTITFQKYVKTSSFLFLVNSSQQKCNWNVLFFQITFGHVRQPRAVCAKHCYAAFIDDPIPTTCARRNKIGFRDWVISSKWMWL